MMPNGLVSRVLGPVSGDGLARHRFLYGRL